MTTTGVKTEWLPLRATAESDALPLFCFPHAGGGASAFRTWVGRLPGLDVLPLQPPGREGRWRESPHQHMSTLVGELATVILDEVGSGDYAVYGHSLGALVAFETVREVRRRGGSEPVHILVSGCAAPHCATGDGPIVSQMTQAGVTDMLRQLGGTPEWLLADPELLEMILPAIRADFSVKDTYEYRHDEPLRAPVTVLASTDDPRAAGHLQERWRDHTTTSFRQHTLTGGHFAVFERQELTHRYLAEALAPWARAS